MSAPLLVNLSRAVAIQRNCQFLYSYVSSLSCSTPCSGKAEGQTLLVAILGKCTPHGVTQRPFLNYENQRVYAFE
jgi:hypothetical protein